MIKQRRAIGIIRVSQVKKRDEKRGGEAFISPEQQRERIEATCEREGLKLLDVLSEMDTSGGSALSARSKGLLPAIELVEAGEADVIVAAYFDRFFRSVKVQAETVERIEAAGGRVLACDTGEISEATAAQWLSAQQLGMMAEYFRRSVRERSGDAQRRAVERGVVPFPTIPPGYRRQDDGTLAIDKREAPAIAAVFAMRADGKALRECREYLRRKGIERSWYSTQQLLRNRIYLGELRFGELVNTAAHEPIVDTDTWRRAQGRAQRSAPEPSNRLLARLGVLRCATCGARLVVGSNRQGRVPYYTYRCPQTGDCPRKPTIGAEVVERAVVEYVQSALSNVEGRATAEDRTVRAQAVLERAQDALEKAIRLLSDLADETATREKLEKLRAERDAAQALVDELGPAPVSLSVSAADWDKLLLEGRRALVKATIASVTVKPGRGADRIAIEAA
jgi:DNA invertase Pin-like site-specific DNA recombinase